MITYARPNPAERESRFLYGRKGLLRRYKHKPGHELLVEIGQLPFGELLQREVARRRGRGIPLRQSGRVWYEQHQLASAFQTLSGVAFALLVSTRG